jgi:hypothetical protein
MFELKRLSADGIQAALERARHYRLLNEPGEAESICHDVLAIDADNQEALVILLLAITDRFGRGYSMSVTEAREVLPKLQDEYERNYFAGIICERRAKALLRQGGPGVSHQAYEYLREAMTWFEKAQGIRPAGNDEALLRWNACARNIMSNKLEPHTEDKLHLQSE